MKEVWGYSWGVGDPALVRVYIKSLGEKIEPDPANPTYIKTVPYRGYVVREPREDAQ